MRGVSKKLYEKRPNALGHAHVNDALGSSTRGKLRRQMAKANNKATKAAAPAMLLDKNNEELKSLESVWKSDTRHGTVSARVHATVLTMFGLAEGALGGALGAEVTNVINDVTLEGIPLVIAVAITVGHGLAFAATGIAVAESLGHIIGRLLRNASTAAKEHRNRPVGFWILDFVGRCCRCCLCSVLG
jgi:hypothetical protein